ncbi:OprD family outer membrane porin [Burkholderia pseudomallei]|uniref:Outer membrane porin, OprD family protein n=1 Tax=Burkholderia pseudomallei TaxID=28450 RepID=A0AA40JIF3_BURPE|nr:OprD family outer membrane porin [Burkholderia pseudomallei]KGS74160.1 outer membrane porin, OprD family protein [Burkholderia pseudomallei MSHR5596]KGX17209.1 outer membrane porin, OprD family protein [Burkholderia pseudomallei]
MKYPRKTLAAVAAVAAFVPAVHAADLESLFTDGKSEIDAFWYTRDREVQEDSSNPAANAKPQRNIRASVLGVEGTYFSGLAFGFLGFDLGGHVSGGTSSAGQTEILHYNFTAPSHIPNYNGTIPKGADDSYGYGLERANLRFQFGDQNFGATVKAGFLPIDVGTIGPGYGLFTHSYRGIEIKGNVTPEVMVGYAWADKYRNEWDTDYHPITNRFNQGLNPAGMSNIGYISFLQTAGFRYTPKAVPGAFVDLGIGESQQFRRNAQAWVGYPVQFSPDTKVTFTGYLQLARYGGANADLYFKQSAGSNGGQTTVTSTEWYSSLAARLQHRDLSVDAGFAKVYAPGAFYSPERGMMLTRLTPYGNSDRRIEREGIAILDDFLFHGSNVFSLGANYPIGKAFGIPTLSAGAKVFYATGVKARADHVSLENTPSAIEKELDLNVTYIVPDGMLKGLMFRVRPSFLRFSKNFPVAANRESDNDIQFHVIYSKQF